MKSKMIKVSTKVTAAMIVAATVINTTAPTVYTAELGEGENITVCDQDSIEEAPDMDVVVEIPEQPEVDILVEIPEQPTEEMGAEIQEVTEPVEEAPVEEVPTTETTEESSASENSSQSEIDMAYETSAEIVYENIMILPEETPVEAPTDSTTVSEEIDPATEEKAPTTVEIPEAKYEYDQKDIDEAGKSAGEVVDKLIKEKYGSTDEAIESIGKSVLRVVNEKVIANIPYVGGFASSAIGSVTEEEDPVVTQLKGISSQIKELKTTIEMSANKIIDMDKHIKQDEKSGIINTEYDNLHEMYSDNLYNYNSAMIIMASPNNSKYRDSDLKEAQENLSQIYEVKGNRKNFNQYINTLKSITSIGLVDRDSELDPDVFLAFDKNVTFGKDGHFADREYAEQKSVLIENVDNTCKYGYNMFSSVINIDLVNQKALLASYDEAIKELTAKRKDASIDQQELITETINRLNTKSKILGGVISSLETDLKTLNDMKAAVDDYVKNEKAKEKEKDAAFNKYEPGYRIDLDGKVVYDMEIYNGKTVYPSFNADEGCVDYRDCYGNTVGTREFEDMKSVSDDEIKVGEEYHFSVKNSLNDIISNMAYQYVETNKVSLNKSCDMKVTEIVDKPINGNENCMIRIVRGINTNTGETFEITIGEFGGYKAYSRTPSQIIRPVNKR